MATIVSSDISKSLVSSDMSLGLFHFLMSTYVMIRAIWFISPFTEYHDLFPIFHKTFRILMHTVHKYLITEFLLHIGDIHHVSFCKFFIFGIVDIGTVEGNNLIMPIVAWSEHEGVISGCGGKLHIAVNAFIGMND